MSTFLFRRVAAANVSMCALGMQVIAREYVAGLVGRATFEFAIERGEVLVGFGE